MRGFLNKKINKVKLTLTTRCNLSCPYCFVDKTNENMDWDVSKKAIDVLIKSKGKDKLLSLYGGEPLLNFDLIKKICPYGINQSKKNNKKLTISICTNLTLVQKKHLDLFNRHNIKIILSLAGEKNLHDSVRVSKNNLGSYDLIMAKLPVLFTSIKKDNLGVSFCVFPKTVKVLEKNFLHLLELGFNYINFEFIRNYDLWHKGDIASFNLKYKKIIKYILSEINNNNFIFINPINWKIAHSYLSTIQCPFDYLLEIYPNGDIAFSPFLLNEKNKEKYLVGNLKKGEQYKFNSCSFQYEDYLCRNCIGTYFKPYKSDTGADFIYRVYRNLSSEAAEYILKRSKNNKKFKNYISRVKGGICF